MFYHRLGVENAWQMPKQIVRTSELYTDKLRYCSRTAGPCADATVRTVLSWVPSQHDVACNDP